MYKLFPSENFKRQYKKLTDKNFALKNKVIKTFEYLQQNPFLPQLKSHKVESKNCGKRFSSSVTGDIRIIWDFSDNEVNVLDLFDLGGHFGGNKVYK